MALTIPERLKDLRVERGLTLEQLAGQTNLSKSALGSYEAMQEELKMNFIWSLACPYCGGHTKIDLDQFVTDTSSDEREMGTETEYTVECDAYECPECKKGLG